MMVIYFWMVFFFLYLFASYTFHINLISKVEPGFNTFCDKITYMFVAVQVFRQWKSTATLKILPWKRARSELTIHYF